MYSKQKDKTGGYVSQFIAIYLSNAYIIGSRICNERMPNRIEK
jgi:hypothetical protein